MPARAFCYSDLNNRTRIIFVSITVSASVVFSAFLYCVFCILYSLVARSRTNLADSTAPRKLQKFSYKELKSATNGFSDSNLIGKGGSGSVYLGLLKDGNSVAIKKLDASSLQSEREFQNELRILRPLKSSYVVTLLGYCAGKRSRFLVYDYMRNGSLQRSLFSDGVPPLNWGRRFEIILDVARALAYLHCDCYPPVIHADVKPSNILLDLEFRAKLSDFGLSRLKMEDASCSEVDFALALQRSCSNASRFCSNSRNSDIDLCQIQTGEGDRGANLGYGEEYVVDLSGEMKSNPEGGKDWWWKQEGSGELCGNDYVAEWIGSQISPANPSCGSPVEVVKKESRIQQWWKEDCLSGKAKNVPSRIISIGGIRFGGGRKSGTEDDVCGSSGEFSFGKGWRKKTTSSGNSQMWSGDLHSSTASMRGTLCYAAPESGECGGEATEKADVYSFGVVILVVVSGRRPLEFFASPMEMEKANLISWCRNLAQFGNVLELVDGRLCDDGFDEGRVRLCINLAMSCLQRSPELRPSISDAVEILMGKMELPAVPCHFAPSPPARMVGRCSRRQNSDVDL